MIETDEYVILGWGVGGSVFEPADWAERLRATVVNQASAAEVDTLVRVILVDGVKAIVVDGRLAKVDAEADRALRRYASDNALRVRPGRAFDRRTLPEA